MQTFGADVILAELTACAHRCGGGGDEAEVKPCPQAGSSFLHLVTFLFVTNLCIDITLRTFINDVLWGQNKPYFLKGRLGSDMQRDSCVFHRVQTENGVCTW